ncbi:MAG: zinc metalloprotease [Saprospiraceae bacterium]
MRTALSVFVLLLSVRLSAQIAPLPVLCGNELFDYIVAERYPALKSGFEQTFEAARARAQEAAVANDRSQLTIRVVVHVVWKNPEENLPDSVILNQIAILNKDFNRLNPDTGDLRSVFLPAAGNPNIKFELETVKRVQTTQNFSINLTSGQLLANLKSGAQGGSDAWDTERYLNIWICRIQPTTLFGIPLGQILGFAFPPNNLPNWPADSGAPTPEQDGVVVDFRVVGSNNPNPITVPGSGPLVVKGRTPVHEIGHYLGLRHIWGDGGLLGLPNDCNQSDGIDDTPFANAQSNFDCDKTRNTCNKVEPFYGADVPDMIENYMDYSQENCMNVFTKGQAALMRAVLDGPRKKLVDTSSSLAAAASPAALALWPNPAGDDFWVAFALPRSGPFTLRLIAADGRATILHSERNAPADGERRMRFDVAHLASGWYALQLITPRATHTQPLLIKR